MKKKSYLSFFIIALTLIAWQAAADDVLTSLTPFGVELGKPFTDNALILSKTDHDTYSELNLRGFPKPLSLMNDKCATDTPVELNSGSASRCHAVLRVNKFDQRVHGISFFARGARVNAKSYIQRVKATLNKKYPSLECRYPPGATECMGHHGRETL
ncbi:MAG: hypothetical protein HWE34_11960 [Methylocystaceae bacterium]|nr:hypothetical protein [Methylocystaceae bacterium]